MRQGSVTRERELQLPSVDRLLDFATRIIGLLMVISTSMFALYWVIELFQGGRIEEMFAIRAAGTIVLATCTFTWLRARRARRHLLAVAAGLTFTTTISICTTLATHYSGEKFDIALGYGLVIAVLNVILWRSIRSLIPGLVGALAPPLLLMASQRPSTDDLVNYLALTGITILLTIAVFVIQQAILDEIIALHEELVAEAGRDDLTGLMNRRHWSACVTEWEATNPRAPYSVLYLDLDNFKALNDRHGHDVGDRVLIDFSRLLSDVVPENAYAARFGGDEFVVFLPGDVNDAHLLADRIRVGMVERADSMYGRAISIGVAQARAGVARHELLREADQAMLIGKVRA